MVRPLPKLHSTLCETRNFMTYRNNTLHHSGSWRQQRNTTQNIKPLRGKPLIHYSIEVARALSPDSHIIVSTDDDEIRSVAQATGLPVDYRRPPELGGDKVGSREVIIDAMDWADKKRNSIRQSGVATADIPLRTVNDVEGCLKLYTPDTDMVVTVTEAACSPYYDCFECSADGLLHVSKGDGRFTRRQDAPKGMAVQRRCLCHKSRFNPPDAPRPIPHRIPYEMPRSRSVDLDTPLDWLITEKSWKMQIDRHIITDDAPLITAISRLNDLSGAVMTLIVTDRDGRMAGTLTDGDVRRALLQGVTLDAPVADAMFRNFRFLREGEVNPDTLRKLRRHRLSLIPLCLTLTVNYAVLSTPA